MEKIEDVILVVAISTGAEGEGCIVEMVKGGQETKQAVEEYGSYLEDIFHEGATPPRKSGLYTFTGGAYGHPGSDLLCTYKGEFKPCHYNLATALSTKRLTT